jgi:hypothetical protein
MEIPFAADTYETYIEDHIDENEFTSYEDCDVAFDAIAKQLAFGPKHASLDKNKKKTQYIRRRYRCSLGGEKDDRYKVDGLDPKHQREKKSTKCECPFAAQARLDTETDKWHLTTKNRN